MSIHRERFHLRLWQVQKLQKDALKTKATVVHCDGLHIPSKFQVVAHCKSMCIDTSSNGYPEGRNPEDLLYGCW